MNDPFSTRLVRALDAFFEAVMRFLPGLLAALLIVALGLVVAWLLKVVVRRLLVLARFDRLCNTWGILQALRRAEIHAAPSALAGISVFWVVLASFGMAALAALEVGVVNQLISSFFLYLPRILAAFVILVAGFLLSGFLARATLLAAVNANVPSPRLISLVVKLLITILSFAMALEQLQIAKSIVLAAFVITFGAVMLCLAIAFGVGGKDVARHVLERQFKQGEEGKGGDELSHL
jgi:hypothetical protein